MYHDLGRFTLSSGEAVSMAAIQGPDQDWASRLLGLLKHKGDPWNWQNAEFLTVDCGIEARFHVLHRDGTPFANVMTAECSGVGILGHVWTNPDDRRKGAAALLMDEVMRDFKKRDGKGLFLFTDFGSTAYHIYETYGFAGIEPQSEYLAYYAVSQEAFDIPYFAPGETSVQSFQWRHWPGSCPLFMGAFPGTVRCAPFKIFGRMSPEGPLLPLIQTERIRRQRNEPPRVYVVESNTSGAVLGLAAWGEDPLWPDTCLLDIYCHPNHWGAGEELLLALAPPDDQVWIAYADSACPQKKAVLAALGFKQTTQLPKRLPIDAAKTADIDIEVLEKRT